MLLLLDCGEAEVRVPGLIQHKALRGSELQESSAGLLAF